MIRRLLFLCLLYNSMAHAAAAQDDIFLRARKNREETESRAKELENMFAGMMGFDVKGARQVAKEDIVRVSRKDQGGMECYEAYLKNNDLVVAASGAYGTAVRRRVKSSFIPDAKQEIILPESVFAMIKERFVELNEPKA